MIYPSDLIPTRVNVTRLPSYLVGRMSGENPLSLDTLQLTGSLLPLALDLVFESLPYYDANYDKPNPLDPIAGTCGFTFRGFDSIWAFYDLTRSGARRFTIGSDHKLWKRLGLPASQYLNGSKTRYWRITGIKESGDLRQIKTTILSIVECGDEVTTNLSITAIATATGRALNPLITPVATASAGQNFIGSPSAVAFIGSNNYQANPAQVPGFIPVYTDIAKLPFVPVDARISSVEASDFSPDTATSSLRQGLTEQGLSDDYQYSYKIAKAFTIQN